MTEKLLIGKDQLATNESTFALSKPFVDAFGGRAVVRCFVGGTGTERSLDASDDAMVESVSQALAGILPLPPSPDDAVVIRWPRAMPQYEVGHLERVARIETALPPGLVVAGQAYRGAGLPDCVRQGEGAAEHVRASL
jgi:oxygen-dependent protoporphyrinogen oxidase